MRSLRFDQTGNLDYLHLQNMPQPTLAGDEVLIQIYAASLNPSDVKNVQGKMEGTTLPRTPGRDFAGVVVEGPSVLLGQAVWGAGGDIGFTRDGSHAEFLAIPSRGARIKPKILSMVEAASVGVNFVTAYLGLIEAAKLERGEKVLVVGSRGGVGSAVVQIARWKQARIFTWDRKAISGAEQAERGIEAAFSAESADQYDALIQQIRSAADGSGPDLVYDSVGGVLFEPALKTLGQLGRQVNITSTGERRVSFDLVDFFHRRLTLHGVDSRSLDTVACGNILDALNPAFDSGQLRPPAIKYRFPLDDFSAAYRALDRNELQGKAVFVLKDE